MVLRIAAVLGVLAFAGCGAVEDTIYDYPINEYRAAAKNHCLQRGFVQRTPQYEFCYGSVIRPYELEFSRIVEIKSRQWREDNQRFREQRRQNELYEAQLEFYRSNSGSRRIDCTTREVYGRLETTCR
jgi:hypothetical protein